MKYKDILIIILSLLLLQSTVLQAQTMIGSTGGLNIPTAEMQPASTFRIGANYVGKGSIESVAYENEGNRDRMWTFDYNTCIYYLDYTAFSWLEVTFRYTMLYSQYNKFEKYRGEYNYDRKDRAMSIKVRPLKESTYCPAVVIGANDPYQITGRGIYASVYGVMSKHLHSNILQSSLMATVGYSHPLKESKMYNGFFGGIKYTHDKLNNVSLEAEYDTRSFNIGVQALLFKHLGLFVFTKEFSNINFGANYQYTIKY